ncbi:MAG: choice-of-anchor Q domain-containing protein, partial [Flavobacterium sp.]|uniref:choice-of-anchor Q domain-containing protein n=1 Tax=Flavobacterium sp. TaxID=239 RepID=UPI0026208F9A
MKKSVLNGLLKLTFLLFSLISMAQTTYYVDSTKPDNSGTGTSWSTAKRDLQIAINTATSGDQIWVKAGTYLPTHDPFGSLTPANNRDKTFTLKNGVKIYGGFSGTENLLSQRNWQTNLTTLSGDLGTLNSLTDNAYHVAISVNLTSATVLDGVIITKGYATAPNGSQITVNTRILERFYGGGVFNIESATTFTNCTIKGNSADCTNQDNDSLGAGIVSLNCFSAFESCIIDSNSFLIGGNSFGVFGAGMLISGGNCVINKCVFSNNTSGSGFIDASRGGALNLNGTHTITNSVFYNNSAQNGAALQFGGSADNTSTVTNCSFVNNTSSFVGTGYQGFSKATFKNCLFWNNAPTVTGVAGRNEIYSQDDRVGFQPSFQNCIIKDALGSPLAITNSILVNCLTSNPLFVNALDGDGLDNIWATSDDGLAIQGTSPVKNIGLTGAGIPTTDIIGNPRDSQPDLGAYEYQNPCVNPTVYNVNGGGSYCAGGVGQVIVVSNSENGVTYQLKNSATNVGSPINGTGNSISFGNQTAAGTYTVMATRTLGGCSSTMNGSASITVNPNITPTFIAVNPICSGATLSALPTTSNNGITGTWSPALNN